MLNNHLIKISQWVNGQDRWTKIWLNDENEHRYAMVTGNWRHTNDSYNSKEIQFCSWSPDWLWWRWTGGAWGGNFEIGADTNRGSHVKGQERDFRVYIFLTGARRTVMDEFEVVGPLRWGSGTLYHPSTLNDFEKGDVRWEVEPYF